MKSEMTTYGPASCPVRLVLPGRLFETRGDATDFLEEHLAFEPMAQR